MRRIALAVAFVTAVNLFAATTSASAFPSAIGRTPPSAKTPPTIGAPRGLPHSSNPRQIADVRIGAGAGTGAVAVNERTGRAYVANGGAWGADPLNPLVSTVTVLDADTNHVITNVPVPSAYGPSTGRPNGPVAFAIDESRNLVYIAGNDGTISVLDGWRNRIVRRFTVPTDPNAFEGVFVGAILLSEHTGQLYISVGNTRIDVVDPRSGNVLEQIADDQAGFMTIDQRTDTIYADHYWDASVSVIDGATGTVTAEIDGVGSPAVPNDCYLTDTCNAEGSGLDGLAVDSDLHHLYVVGTNDGSLVTIDTRTNQVVRTQTIGGNLFNVAVDPWTHRVYTISDLGATMAVVDGQSGKVLATGIPVGPAPSPPDCQTDCTIGGLPQGLTVDGLTGRIYVGDYGDITTADPLGEVVVFDGRAGSWGERCGWDGCARAFPPLAARELAALEQLLARKGLAR